MFLNFNNNLFQNFDKLTLKPKYLSKCFKHQQSIIDQHTLQACFVVDEKHQVRFLFNLGYVYLFCLQDVVLKYEENNYFCSAFRYVWSM